jgi:SpoVK/Ycf46/Vps4 family AAA+-type ATPase
VLNLDSITKKEVKSIWKEQIDELFQCSDTKSEMYNFLSILNIIINNRFDEKIINLYDIIGNIDTFTSIIDCFSGLTITIPEKDEFRESLIVALSYYYKELKGYSWKEIQKIIPYEDNISIKASKGIGKVKKELKEVMNILFLEQEENKNE